MRLLADTPARVRDIQAPPAPIEAGNGDGGTTDVQATWTTNGGRQRPLSMGFDQPEMPDPRGHPIIGATQPSLEPL